jgi:GxxExxY protein
MIDERYKHSELTDKIIKAFYNVYNTLGYGFLEKVYENSMVLELKKMGLDATSQKAIKVYYDAQEVGDYFADLVVNDCIIVELKSVESIGEQHEAQLINYLKASSIEVGLLLNFGKSPQFKKKVFSNDFKDILTEVK